MRIEDLDGPPYPWWALTPPRDWPNPLPPITADDDGPFLPETEPNPYRATTAPRNAS